MSRHMKRLASPRVWSIPRKTNIWTVSQSPGPHPVEMSVPLLIMVRDMLGYCDTAREGRRIIGERHIHIDGRVTTNYKMPVGFMDVISIPRTKENYRALLDSKGKLKPIRIPKDRANWKLSRIENITTIKGGRRQLNLHDGRNIIAKEGKFRTGDVLKIELPSQKILNSYPLAKGNVAMIIGGKHSGQIATIENYKVIKSPKPNIVEFKEGFSTLKDHVFVVGKKSPEITVPEVSAV